MPTFCPKCDEDISNFLYQLELEDKNFIEFEKCECPKCSAKLLAKLEVSFYVEEDEVASYDNNKTELEK